ncbi:MAG: LysM peptidoglycan-binding domain-containing protein [Chthoniobacterales bacterium]
MSVWQKLVVIVLAAALVGAGVFFSRLVLMPPKLRPVPWVEYVHPNVEKLREAQRLVEKSQLPEARDMLVRALTGSPVSPVTRELRDLLGEINTRLFFEKESSMRKTDYIVKRGDALSSIARKLQSSTDAIMRVNALDSTLLRPGDKLVVPQLDFTITIDLPRGRVIVHDGHGFFTQYPIASVDLPKTRAAKVETRVNAKSFWDGGKPVARSLGKTSQDATPWIFLKRRGYVLYGVEENSEASEPEIEVEGGEEDAASQTDRPAQGIAMLKPDIKELEVLIQRGTPVTIILQRK